MALSSRKAEPGWIAYDVRCNGLLRGVVFPNCKDIEVVRIKQGIKDDSLIAGEWSPTDDDDAPTMFRPGSGTKLLEVRSDGTISTTISVKLRSGSALRPEAFAELC